MLDSGSSPGKLGEGSSPFDCTIEKSKVSEVLITSETFDFLYLECNWNATVKYLPQTIVIQLI